MRWPCAGSGTMTAATSPASFRSLMGCGWWEDGAIVHQEVKAVELLWGKKIIESKSYLAIYIYME